MMKRLFVILFFLPASSFADEALIAVATNFQPMLEELRNEFEESSSHQIKLSAGSTGMLFAHIVNGAPYDAFLAADQWRPEQLEREGIAVAGTRFTYAEGRLALWSRNPDFVRDSFKASLENPALRVLAIANPDLAPYGYAAERAIHSVTLAGGLNARLVFGENAGQAFSMAATGNADAGVVALATVLLKPDWLEGAYLEVPGEIHPSILQDAVLLKRGAGNAAALEFLEFLQSAAVRGKLAAHGYRK